MRSRIHKIAVLDNGSGMNASVLRLALQFGNGTYLEEEQHTGIGRFGMGLPSSSVSQCQRVEVWTWQDGVENALYSYLDLNEIRTQRINEVPSPQLKPIPSIWQQVGKNFDRSGTLVVWSDIDRCMWKTGKTITDNSELLIGRMYRKFLDAEEVAIRMLAFDLDNPSTVITEKFAKPNDPGYLMAKTSCPVPFDNKPMFQLKEELRDDEDPREPLLEIAHKINTQLSTLRRLIKAQRKGTRPKNNRYSGSTPERQATRVTENRKQDGYKGISDKDEYLPALERQTTIEKTLTEAGVTENQAKELAATTISDNLKYVFVDADLDNPAFFSVKPKGGAIVITLNTKHPAYENLVEILEDEVENVDPETLRSRLAKSRKGIKLLLAAWARYEDEQPEGKRQQNLQDSRVEWGKIARQFLENEE